MLKIFIMTMDSYQKTEEVINRFKNGRERYHRSALFNKVVQMLVRGVDEYEIINDLINITQDSTNALEQYIYRDDRPIIIDPDKVKKTHRDEDE